MPRRPGVVLEDILDTISLVESAIGAKDRAAFAADLFLQRGVERSLEIISEAVRHLPEAILAKRPEIAWTDIRSIGNLIRHEYWRVDPDILWAVITDDLPPLRMAIEAMLKRVDE
ncbi:HepT-like ribonuclease domain-containing protein [Rhabdaerophilum sp. SD176]|uniref:HepT-like ribonuclease domain-containing protein n=1 Tax=Rhabdaerophilum sp. SD176 TaxID=2983548 RepID=UPI0024DF9B65|nr:HepT-like ribonuclease domain-containing protein [Rhabdaerophilum sp. SD176]